MIKPRRPFPNASMSSEPPLCPSKAMQRYKYDVVDKIPPQIL